MFYFNSEGIGIVFAQSDGVAEYRLLSRSRFIVVATWIASVYCLSLFIFFFFVTFSDFQFAWKGGAETVAICRDSLPFMTVSTTVNKNYCLCAVAGLGHSIYLSFVSEFRSIRSSKQTISNRFEMSISISYIVLCD
jgi:hypothetical protein